MKNILFCERTADIDISSCLSKTFDLNLNKTLNFEHYRFSPKVIGKLIALHLRMNLNKQDFVGYICVYHPASVHTSNTGHPLTTTSDIPGLGQLP